MYQGKSNPIFSIYGVLITAAGVPDNRVVMTISSGLLLTMACLYEASTWASVEAIKRVPILTPAAPRVIIEAMVCPLAIPPAAITGIDNFFCNQLTKTIGDRGPACPPAPLPTAMTPSAPKS